MPLHLKLLSITSCRTYILYFTALISANLLHGHFCKEPLTPTAPLTTLHGFRTDLWLTQLCILNACLHTLHTVGAQYF